MQRPKPLEKSELSIVFSNNADFLHRHAVLYFVSIAFSNKSAVAQNLRYPVSIYLAFNTIILRVERNDIPCL